MTLLAVSAFGQDINGTPGTILNLPASSLASPSGNGTKVVTTTGTQTQFAIVFIDGNGNHIPSGCSIDGSGNISCPGGVTSGSTSGFNGMTLWQGASSGASGFVVANTAGTAILYIMPTGPGTATYVLTDNGAVSCPTDTPTSVGVPSLCHQLAWVAPSGGGGSTVPTTGWTLYNASGAALTFDNYLSSVVSFTEETSDGTLEFGGGYQAVPGSTYTVVLTVDSFPSNITQDTQDFGLMVTDGTKFESLELLLENSISGGKVQLEMRQSSGPTGSGGSIVHGPTVTLVGTVATLEVVEDGTHRTWYYYTNGSFTQFYQEATNNFLTPTGVGVLLLNDTTPKSLLTVKVIGWTATSP